MLKQKVLEGRFNPIMMRVYQAAGPGISSAAAAAGGFGTPNMPGDEPENMNDLD